jgi:hypothetical protein
VGDAAKIISNSHANIAFFQADSVLNSPPNGCHEVCRYRHEYPRAKGICSLQGPENKVTFIVMEYIPSATLQLFLPSLTPVEKASICQSLKDAIIVLRKTPLPNWLGGLTHEIYHDAVFWSENVDPAISGPFRNHDEENKVFWRR